MVLQMSVVARSLPFLVGWLLCCCLPGAGLAEEQSAAQSFPLGTEVFAIRELKYSTSVDTVTVPEGTLGEVVENETRLVVQWALQPQATEGVVEPTDLERRACAELCDGLVEYMAAAGAATRNDALNRAQRCLVMRGHADAAACALNNASAATACPAMAPLVEAQAEQCAQLGIDIASGEGEVEALFQRVFALENLQYNSATGVVIVPAGVTGMIVERPSDDGIIVEWELEEALLGPAPQEKIENATCLDDCAALQEYLTASSEAVVDPLLTPLERCEAIQGFSNTTACGLAEERRTACPSMWALFDSRSKSCSGVGIQLSNPDLPTNFVHTPCKYCSYVTGAVDLSGQPFPEYHDLSMSQCESTCSADSACAAFDYDTDESRCRLWQRCPEQSQRTSSCNWGIFARPRPTTAEPPMSATTTVKRSGLMSIDATPATRYTPATLAVAMAAAAATMS